MSKDWLRTVMPTATILNDDVLCAEMLTIAAAAEERGRLAANAAWRDALSEELHDIGATEIHSEALRKLFGGDDVV